MLSLVQTAREALHLDARDIAVLRGLLGLVRAENWSNGRPVFVHASNATLIERCDGIQERTLRRRLDKLQKAGLVQRVLSPNRKRYQVRDEEGQVILSYGFDLAPLRAMQDHLQALAESCQRAILRIKALRAILRDRLWQLSQQKKIDCSAETRLLRNKVEASTLEAAIRLIESHLGPATPSSKTTDLSDNDRQNDRHIQSSIKEESEKNVAMNLGTCLDLIPEAVSYSTHPIESWDDLDRLVQLLGPAIGIDTGRMNTARAVLGPKGRSLAIMGLVQAGNRIKSPGGYLQAIMKQAASGALKLQDMYHSLCRRHGFRPET